MTTTPIPESADATVEALRAVLTQIAEASPEPDDKEWYDPVWYGQPAPYRERQGDGLVEVRPDQEQSSDMDAFGFERGLHAAAIIARTGLAALAHTPKAATCAPAENIEVLAQTVGEAIGDLNEGQVFGAREFRFIAERVNAMLAAAPPAPQPGAGGEDAKRLHELKVQWSNHAPLSEGDHAWLLEAASRGLASAAPAAPAAEPDAGVRDAEERAAICRELGCIDKPGVPLSFVQDLRRRYAEANRRNGDLIRSWDPATPTERQELDRMRRGWGPSSPTERERRRLDVATCLSALSTAMTNLSVGEDEEVPEEAQERLDLAYERVRQQYTKVAETLHALVADPQEWPDIKAAEERGAMRAVPSHPQPALPELGARLAEGICPTCDQGLPDYCRNCDEQWLCDKSGCAHGKLTLEAPDDIIASHFSTPSPGPEPRPADVEGLPPIWHVVVCVPGLNINLFLASAEQPSHEQIAQAWKAQGGSGDLKPRGWEGPLCDAYPATAKVERVEVSDFTAPSSTDHLPTPSHPAHRGAEEALERVRHVKRGTEYEVLGEAEVQISSKCTCPDGIGNGVLPNSGIIREGRAGYESDRLTVYRDPENGKLWCSFTDEFRDGRFETLSSATADQTEGRS